MEEVGGGREEWRSGSRFKDVVGVYIYAATERG